MAFGFIDALQQAYTFVGEMPAAGSPRWSHELNLPGLRTIRLKGFPWLVFYLELETHVDVWRVLHAKRDMPAWLADVDDGRQLSGRPTPDLGSLMAAIGSA